MITPKIKALFQFIEFLHSNSENFKQFDSTINELYLLDIERKKLSPQKNFAEKMKYDEVQAEIKDKFSVIQENIIQPINSKVLELNICDINKTETLQNWNISEISDLINNFKKEDLPEIFKHKSKYLEFRTKTNCTYFKDFFFDDLDEMLKELFDYFKETEHNEFEAFEIKAIQVNDFQEAFELIQKGHKKFTLPFNLLNLSKVQRINNENLLPHQTETKTDKLKIELGKYGFFELSKVKQLSEPNKQRLTELISTNDLPYSIAMFEYLGFLKYLKAEHFKTDYKLFKAVASWFEVAERTVKGNIHVLNEFSKENRTRYTADQQKQTVQKNYEVLK
jgi:hypothetical protein